jgi:hypothetical protein
VYLSPSSSTSSVTWKKAHGSGAKLTFVEASPIVFDASVSLANVMVRFFKSFADNSTSPIGSPQTTNGSGWAVLSLYYNVNWTLGLYAFAVTVDNAEIVAVSYVGLTVSKTTRLTFVVEKRDTSTVHVLFGRLASYGQGVDYELIDILINGTLYNTILTDENGCFCLELNLQPSNTSEATYSLEAVFEGETSQSVTSYFHMSNGTEYAICTTIYYEFKPSSYSVLLTVSPQSTDTMTPTKTPEEVQQEAKDSYWLREWHEFTWWYPWYRLHVEIYFEDPTIIDVGFSPILPGGEVHHFEGLEFFQDVLEEFVEELQRDVVLLFGEYVSAKILSFIPPWGLAAIPLSLKFVTQLGMLLNSWNDHARMGAVVLVNIIMGLIACAAPLGAAFLSALQGLVYAETMSALYMVLNGVIVAATPIQFLRSWVDAVEIFMDFGFAVTAYARFRGVI